MNARTHNRGTRRPRGRAGGRPRTSGAGRGGGGGGSTCLLLLVVAAAVLVGIPAVLIGLLA